MFTSSDKKNKQTEQQVINMAYSDTVYKVLLFMRINSYAI